MGIVHWDVAVPNAKGPMIQCVRFIETHKAPDGYQLELVNLDTKHVIHNFDMKPEKSRVEVRWYDLVVRRW